ncbi:peptide chain release factor N(5)-glutamine methyltransferase [Edaphobacter sp. 4G125]|nr:peptide chain release factor N(5)-glutamine methyltransferase [Edaphobacter sp. 4G125]
MTLREAIQSAAERLAQDQHLRDSARRDAELLLQHRLNLTRAGLLANPARSLTPTELQDYENLIARRLLHEPVQYITGVQEFYALPLRVTPAVLIPRPETEHLVEAVLERLPHDRPVTIVDIGTGSGAIALALATHLPQAAITAIDLSPAALEIAKANAHALELSSRVRFLVSDLLASLSPSEIHAGFDAIVSNPPYIPASDASGLHPQVREHEPRQALFAGVDGLEIYRRLIPQAFKALKPGGLLAVEIGHGQKNDLATLLAGWTQVVFVDDLQSIPRVALARRTVNLV